MIPDDDDMFPPVDPLIDKVDCIMRSLVSAEKLKDPDSKDLAKLAVLVLIDTIQPKDAPVLTLVKK